MKRQTIRSVGRALRTYRPLFAFGGPLPQGGAPPFVYHDVEPSIFEQDLDHLVRNHYRTVSTDEFVESKGGSAKRKVVLITFDDARRNFLEVALPLLRRYHARATLFVPTAWVGRTVETAGRRFEFLTWEELAGIASEGIVDIQSHGHRHALVPVGLEPEGFVTKRALENYDIFEWSVVFPSGELLPVPPRAGWPIFPTAPLFSADAQVHLPWDLWRRCEEIVAGEDGGDAGTPATERRLRQVITDGTAKDPPRVEMTQRLVEHEFETSRGLFEEHLGYTPRHFAFPWELGSRKALEVAARLGIRTVFGVGFDFARVRRLPSPLVGFGRLRGDYVKCLPGSGRRSAFAAMADALRRLKEPEHVSH